jgi:hypothetical protein
MRHGPVSGFWRYANPTRFHVSNAATRRLGSPPTISLVPPQLHASNYVWTAWRTSSSANGNGFFRVRSSCIQSSAPGG